MDDKTGDRFWIRSGRSNELSGPFDYDRVVTLARANRLMPFDRIALSTDGPWIAPTEVTDLAEAMSYGKAAHRTFAALIPHLVCLTALALLGFSAPDLTGNAIDGARVVVAVCAFAIASAYDDPVMRAPRWLFVLVGVVFLIPMRIPLNRGGWLVIDWLAGCATVLHGRAVVQRIENPSFFVRTADQILSASIVVLFFAALAMLRCEGTGNDFE